MSPSQKRAGTLAVIAAITLAAIGAIMFVPTAGGSETLTIYKNPSCGCCADWADQMEARGYRIETKNTAAMAAVFAEHGIRSEIQSCHLAIVGDYLFVGHVPPAEVVRLVASGEPVKGLAAPGMPAGSAGMEMPDGRTDTYQVLVLDNDGGVRPLGRFQGETRLD